MRADLFPEGSLFTTAGAGSAAPAAGSGAAGI